MRQMLCMCVMGRVAACGCAQRRSRLSTASAVAEHPS
jgi:hypothetical protein